MYGESNVKKFNEMIIMYDTMTVCLFDINECSRDLFHKMYFLGNSMTSIQVKKPYAVTSSNEEHFVDIL